MGHIHPKQYKSAEVVGVTWLLIGVLTLPAPPKEWVLFLGSGIYLISYHYFIDIAVSVAD
jgi:uncharacterized membrane protein YkgB